MPVDPSIALQFRGIQLQQPIEQAGNVLGLLGLLQKNKLAEMQLAHLAEMRPMEREKIGLQLDELRHQNTIMENFIKARTSGGAPSGAPAAGGVSPAQNQQSLVNFPPEVDMALMHPKLQAWGKEMAQQYRVSEKVREAIQLGYKPGTPAFNNFVGGISSPSGVFSAPDPVTGNRTLDPNYAAAQGQIKAAEEAARAGFRTEKVIGRGPDGVVREFDIRASQLEDFYAGKLPIKPPTALGGAQPPATTPTPAPGVAGAPSTDVHAQLMKYPYYAKATPEEQFAIRQVAVQGGSANVPKPYSSVVRSGKATPGEDEADKTAAREGVEELMKNYGVLRNSQATISNIAAAKKLIPSARAFMGPGGEPLMTAASFLNNRLGTSINVEGITDATELRSRIFFQIMDNLKKLDAQPSQQQQFIMQEALGRLGTDPNAMSKILDAYEDVLRDRVETHNKDVASARESGVQFRTNATVNLTPREKRSGDSAPSSFDRLPDPKQYMGKRIYDNQLKRYYRSNGTGWVPE